MIWLSNKLEGTLPVGISQYSTFNILQKLINNPPDVDRLLKEYRQEKQGKNAEKDRVSRRQLIQHMAAYLRCEKAVEVKEPLSEEMIKDVHKTMMDGLETEEGDPMNAGEYRQIPLHADDHVFPAPHCVPSRMRWIVEEYNKKASDPNHDPYQLASWLLFHVVSLHPFRDGNGRLCRLLWCYSLMRDGLPFPLTISSGHKKAHKHYVRAIDRSQRCRGGDHPHLTTLTVLSVGRSWNNFVFNLYNYELPAYQVD